ncbi:MAG: M20 family metallopeptidase [Chloroflexi bacterium]|nr:M20 family metallopeptidase [Chloroflexota bacterium]MBM3174152.1 M20 family metallopeptidase [Chloroflexota bacterium]MBM4449220.1 M20 family metallopeptidase [Chloroflexota bacterium]
MSKKTLSKADLKAKICQQVDRQRGELVELSLRIHANPELGFEEVKAIGWLTDYLGNNGFVVEVGIGGFATAFKAFYGEGGPYVALLAEYDALPGVGHACGHNVIAAAAVGAGVASRVVVDNCGGTVIVFGTPAEELHGGKVGLLRAGVFEGVDVALMVHPGVRNRATGEALACVNLDIEFFGKAAHAAAYPDQGVNALEAMILAFNAINSLRQHIKEKARIHGIITHGGHAANVVPAYTAAKLLVRAPDNAYLEELKRRVLGCLEGAALATGARLACRWGDVLYEPLKSNRTLAKIFANNLEVLGRKVEPLDAPNSLGSTDMGNVSQVVPAIHPTIAIASPGTLLHSDEFARAAASETASEGVLDAAKALAMTVVDLMSEPRILAKVKAEFAGLIGRG